MSKIKFIVDSTVDLPLEILKENNVDMIPLSVNIAGNDYQDTLDIDTSKMFEMMEDTNIMPKTGAVSPFVFEEKFRHYVNEGYEVIYLGLSSFLSSTYNNAFSAKNIIGNHVHVIDSKNLSSAIGLLLLEMIKLNKEGKSVQEIVFTIKKIIPNVKCSFALETMKYIHLGGRCKSISYYFGKILHIHPVLKMDNGQLKVDKLPRGKFKKAIDYMIDCFKKDYLSNNVYGQNVMITHCMNLEMKDYIYLRLKEFVKSDTNIIVSQSGCVISAHCGPKCIGILYIKK